jgi:tagatose 1,6-diphosphate aldolase
MAAPIMLVPPGELGDDEFELRLNRFELHPTHCAPTYQFLMFHLQTGEELGNIRLSVSSTPYIERYAGHLGYGVRPQHRGHHYAARAVRLLIPLAKQLNLDPLWITCDPENLASRRTLELAGAEFVEIVDVPPDCIIHKCGHPRKCRYRLALNA